VAPGDPEIEGSAQAGALGMLAVLNNDTLAAATFIERGVTELDRLPQQGPAPYRGLWPLMQAARGDPAAPTSIADARRRGLTVSRLNVGLLGWADAILAGRAGNPTLAADLARAAEQSLRPYGLWADLARMYGGEQGCADGWGTPDAWLSTAAASFTRHHIEPLASRCRNTLERPRPTAWTRLGITEREAEVLRLVAEGWPNKTIASRLHRSHRTIEKHIESLLRKTNTHTRTELVAVAGPHAAWTQPWP
jgi:DNA-binding CsgD family transcriptional regulator